VTLLVSLHRRLSFPRFARPTRHIVSFTVERIMRNELHRIISPGGPDAAIGEAGLRLHLVPIRRRIDFYDTAGRLHGLIALVPIMYGIVQTQRGRSLQPWYWYMVVAILGFAIFARRAPYLRLSPNGLSFPERKSPEYPWDQMCEAHARADELDILMTDGKHVAISYKKMNGGDVARVKRLIKLQFQLMAARAQAEDTPNARAA